MITRGNGNGNTKQKIYGHACGKAFKLWQRVALWPIHVCRVQ